MHSLALEPPLTLPCLDDIENQKAARIAKLADPHGVRTIGEFAR